MDENIETLYYALGLDDAKMKQQLEDAIKNLSRLDDEFNRINKTIEETFNMKVGETKVQKEVESLTNDLRKLEAEWKNLTLVEKRGARGQQIRAEYEALRKEAGNLTESLSEMYTESQKAAAVQAKMAEAQKKVEKAAMDKYYASLAKEQAAFTKAQEKAIIASEKLAAAQEKQRSKQSAGEFKEYIQSLTKQSDISKQMSAYYKSLERQTAKAVAEQEKMANAQKRVANEVRKVNGEFTLQNRLLSNLKTLFTTYISVFAVKKFVQSLAEVRGEFEKQQISLRAILRDAEAADKIFNQIKGFSVTSPFRFKELISYAKQLSAFQVPVDELFETTKKLADVSAGLGVGMDRIILAYGQVRSASVLRGQELRQFTEAGIPLVDELAKKFSELEGRVVSAFDVFEKISNREVPFKMIKEILMDMTKEGGIFYNMQEKQAESLKGKISNLMDAYDIMLNDIGKANDGILKGGVEGIAKLMKNWRGVADALKTVVVTLGTYKAAVTILNISDRIAKYSSLANAIRSTAVAQKLLNSTLADNPWILAVTAVAAFGTEMYNTYQEAHRLKNELEDIANKQSSKTNDSIKKFEELNTALNGSVKGSQQYRDVISRIDRLYGEYLPNLLNESNALLELKKNYDLITDAIYNKAKAQAAEKGRTKIEEEFGDAQREYTTLLIQNLKSDKITEKAAKDLVSSYRKELEKQVGEYSPTDIFNKIYQDYFQTTEKYFTLAGELAEKFREGTPFLRSGSWGWESAYTSLVKYSDIFDRIKSSTKEYDDYIDIIFSKTGYNTAEEARQIDKITKKYEGLRAEAYRTASSQEAYNEALKRLNLEKLKETLSYYEKIAQEFPKLARPDAIKRLRSQIDALETVSVNWVNAVDGIIGKEKAGFQFKPQENESEFDYLDKLTKRYKELIAQRDLIDKGLLVSDETKKSTGEQLDLLLKIGKALGYSFDIESKSLESQKSGRIQLLKEELSLLEEAKDDYDKLALWQPKASAGQNINTVYGIDFDEKGIEARAKEIITRIAAISADEGKKVQKSFDKWLAGDETGKIIDGLRKMLDAVTEEIDAYKEKYNFYEQLLGLGETKEKAIDISFGVTFEGEPDIVKYLQDKIRETVGNGVDIDLGVNIISKDFKDVFKNIDIPDEKQKKLMSFFKLLKKQLIDFQTQASTAKKELSHMIDELENKDFNLFGEGFKFDISKIARDTINAYSKIDERERDMTARLAEFKDDKEKEIYEKQLKRLHELGEKEKESIRKQSQEKLNDLATKMLKEGLDKEGLKGIFNDLSDATFKQLGQLKKYFEQVSKIGIGLSIEEAEEKLKKVGLSIDELKDESMDEIVLKINSTSLSDADKKVIALILQLKKAGQSVQDLEDALKSLSNAKLDKIKDELKRKISRSIQEVSQGVVTLGENIAELGTGNEGFKNLGNDISQIGNLIGDMGEAIMGVSTKNPEEVIKGIFGVINAGLKAEAQHRKALAEIKKAEIEQQREYNLLLMKQNLLFEKGTNIFGTDKIGKVINAISVYTDAIAEYKKELKGTMPEMTVKERATNDFLGSYAKKMELFNEGIWGLAQGKVRTGHKKGFIGIGARDIYSPILKVFDDLIDKEGNLKKDRAQSILDTKKLDDYTKRLLEDLIKLQDQADEAYKEMQSSLQETFGSLGDSLTEAIVNAFENGTDAAQDFREEVENILKKLAMQLVYTIIFEKDFDKLQKEIEDIYKKTENTEEGKKKVVEQVESLLGNFIDGLNDKIEASEQLLKKIDEQAKLHGFDIFKGEEGAGLAQGIKGVTEDTAQLLASYINAIRASDSLIEMYAQSIDANVAGIYQSMGGSPNITTFTTLPPEIISAISEPMKLNNNLLYNIDANISSTHSIAANALAQLTLIQANTYNAAVATREAVEDLRSLMYPGHPKGGYGIKVWV